MADLLCPCGSTQPFQRCCQPYLVGDAIAPTPEALMRSRYSAFATSHVNYLIKTHHPSQRSLNEKRDLMQTCRTTTWKQLVVLDAGLTNEMQGYVEFMAVYQTNELGQLHERSNFVKESGQWLYLSGTILPPVQPKRGEPCWCGSGKKYKKCHG